MSLICLCVVKDVRCEKEKNFYIKQIEELAKQNKRGVKFYIDWFEPLLSYINKDSFVINILDSPKSDNCELLLLPDNWSINGISDKLSFRERICFLQDIAKVFVNRNHSVELYLSESGTCIEDFLNITLKINNLVNYLSESVGIYGIDDGLHISIET